MTESRSALSNPPSNNLSQESPQELSDYYDSEIARGRRECPPISVVSGLELTPLFPQDRCWEDLCHFRAVSQLQSKGGNEQAGSVTGSGAATQAGQATSTSTRSDTSLVPISPQDARTVCMQTGRRMP